jgi:hypothetical protein
MEQARKGMCQKRALVVHMDEFSVLLAFTIKHARFAETNKHIYLLLKKKKHSTLDV